MGQTKIAEILTMPTKVWGAISLTGTVILVGEPLAKRYSGGAELYAHLGIWVLMITLLAYSFLVIAILINRWNRFAFWLAIQRATKYVNGMSEDKKNIVLQLYKTPSHVLEFPMVDQRIIELENRFVIGKAASQREVMDLNGVTWPYMLQPWVIDKIEKNKISFTELNISGR